MSGPEPERIFRHHIRRLAVDDVVIHRCVTLHDQGVMDWEETINTAAFHLAKENKRLKEEVVRLERQAP